MIELPYYISGADLFWIGFHVTGVLLSAAIWLFIKLPFALILGDKIE